jgi:hypothetical protein
MWLELYPSNLLSVRSQDLEIHVLDLSARRVSLTQLRDSPEKDVFKPYLGSFRLLYEDE